MNALATDRPIVELNLAYNKIINAIPSPPHSHNTISGVVSWWRNCEVHSYMCRDVEGRRLVFGRACRLRGQLASSRDPPERREAGPTFPVLT